MPPSPTAPLASRTVMLADEAASMQLGSALARGIVAHAATPPPGLVITFSGDLGAGKTTLVRALLRALGVTGRIKSPTFTLVEPYEIVLPLPAQQHPETSSVELTQNLSIYCYHFDLYRFTDPREFLEAGFREYFNDHSICLVEWPERVREHLAPGAPSLLPDPDLAVRLEASGAGRRVSLCAWSERGARCLSAAVS